MGHDFEALSSKIIEVAISVHKELGPGFLESIDESLLTNLSGQTNRVVKCMVKESRKHERAKARNKKEMVI